ncbi:MAG TPA: GlsB/YeaQ/YmgE family stress response membrane protein [Longimicrobiales bacterium]|nr:GlsB/YeaQ/YmgE family stress response membrane protein [Longimicrobiales bacterium]
MGLASWILFGLIAGGLAKFIMPGKDPGGCLGTILIGIGGSLLGGFLGTEVFDFGRVTGFDVRSFAIAILGTLLLLIVYRLIVGRR